MEKAEIINRLRMRQPMLKAKGVTHLAIFGSRARGDANKDSDLDVLLDVPWGSKFSLLDLVGIERELGDLVGIPANAFMRRSLDEEFAQTIKPDIIEVF